MKSIIKGFIITWIATCPICDKEFTSESWSTEAPVENHKNLLECPYCHNALWGKVKEYKKEEKIKETELKIRYD